MSLSPGLQSRAEELFKQHFDTTEIALMLNTTEHQVYNAIYNQRLRRAARLACLVKGSDNGLVRLCGRAAEGIHRAGNPASERV